MKSNLALKDDTPELFADVCFEMVDDAAIKKSLGTDDIPDGTIAGWASTSDLDSYRHVVEEGAFTEAIQKRGLVGPRGIRLLNNHNWSQISGMIKQLKYQGDKLWIAAQFNLNLGYAKDMFEVCKMTGGMNFSVGFYLQDYSWKEDDQKREYLSIKRGDLFEVSVVPFPANEKATMEIVKSRESSTSPASLAEFEKALVAQGLVKNRNEARDLTRIVKQNINLFAPSQVEDSMSVANKLVEDVSKKLAGLKSILSSATSGE